MSATNTINGQTVSIARIPSLESLAVSDKVLESESDCYVALFGANLGAAQRTTARLNAARSQVVDAMTRTDDVGGLLDAFAVLTFLARLIRVGQGVRHD